MLLFVFQFDYQFVNSVYQQLINTNQVFIPVMGIKIFAIALVLINWYNKFLKSTDDPDSKRPPLKVRDYFTAIFIVAAISSYDQVLSFFDYILGSIENQYSLTNQVKPFTLNNKDITQAEADKDWTTYLKEMGSIIVEIFYDPFYIVLKILESLAWLIDLLIYGSFLAERFFFLGIFRVFGGLTMAFMAFEKLEKWFWNWLGLYVAVYLTIIPYFLINAFTNKLYYYAQNKINPENDITFMDSLPMAIVLIFIAAVKLKLFTKSGQIVMKIFN